MPAPGETESKNPAYRTSFILRCWFGAGGQARAVLIDVHSGVVYPVAALAQLPALLETILPHYLARSETEPPPAASDQTVAVS